MNPLQPASHSLPFLIPRRRFLGGLAAGGAALTMPNLWLKADTAGGSRARGRVFHDRDGDGRMGPDDPGLAGIAVSNGLDITLTDERGQWELPLLDTATDFHVIPGRGWTVPVSADQRRRFHYLHQPAGSPKSRFPGLEPTGPLPESIDFPLLEQEQADRFRVLVCGDPQPRNHREVGFLARSVPGPLAEEDAAFAVALGDISFDDLALFGDISGALGASGLPWHYVIGNHDLNFDAPDRFLARQTYRRHFGPTAYAFNHGAAHFVVLDNIDWLGAHPDHPGSTGRYRGLIDDRQLEFLKNDLAHVPEDTLVVLFLHIPLFDEIWGGERNVTSNRRALSEVLADRRHTLSFAAHTHTVRHQFLGKEQDWQSDVPHHHIVAGALCGSWFRGAPGPDGIPHATMTDGTPRGYLPLDIDGNTYRIPGYRPFNSSGSGQMHVHLPEAVASAATAQTAFHVNAYNTCERSTVRARIGAGGAWLALDKVAETDPAYRQLHERDANLEKPWFNLPGPIACSHLWAGTLPANLPPGTHPIEIEATDGFGGTHRNVVALRVTA